MRFLMIAVVVLIAGVVFGQPDARPARVPGQFLIVPGQGIGEYRLSWSIQQFVETLGEPSYVGPSQFKLLEGETQVKVYFWEHSFIEVLTRVDDLGMERVVAIAIYWHLDDPSVNSRNHLYRDIHGIGLSSTIEEVGQVYGKLYKKESFGGDAVFRTYASGIVFGYPVMENPNVAMIGVFIVEK